MGVAEPAAPGSGGALDLIGQRFVAQLQRRLALFAVEVTEEELRFARLLGWQLMALFLTCLTLTLLALLVVGTWWDTAYRVAAIAWACGGAALGSIALWLAYRAHVMSKPVVFAQTLLELERDARALDPRAAEPQA